MKNKLEKRVVEKGFDTVKYFRGVKENISKKIYRMSLSEIKEYLKNRNLEFNRK